MTDHMNTIMRRLFGDLTIDEESADARLIAKAPEMYDALRYIAGEDVPGYEAHMRPEEVAQAVLASVHSRPKERG